MCKGKQKENVREEGVKGWVVKKEEANTTSRFSKS